VNMKPISPPHAQRQHVQVDILMASDLRFPGGTTASMVEEVRAQEQAGYSSALLHLPSPVQRSRRGFAPRIRDLIESGDVRLVLGEEPVRAKLLVIRHPTVLMALPKVLPRIDVDQVLIVANQVPVDSRARVPYYDAVRCDDNARRLTGRAPQWTPIGPDVRKSLAPYQQKINMQQTNWNNIIDVDSWYLRRTGFVSEPPTIGRHSRGDWSKWPADRQTLTEIYPTDGSYAVKILGGVETPREILGYLPDNWIDLPFNSVPPQEFLKGIDFLVYYHHPGLVEAFGRTVLEGIAAGAVAIVDPSFKPTFGESALYATPGEVQQVLRQLRADPEAYRAQSEKGARYSRDHFSYATHQRRIKNLIGPATHRPAPETRSLDRFQTPSILVDVTGRFNAWERLPESTVALVAAGAFNSLPESVAAEYVPAYVLADPQAAKKYISARVSSLSEVFGDAPVFEVGDGAGSLSLRAPHYRLSPADIRCSETRVEFGGWYATAVTQSNVGPRSGAATRAVSLLRQKAPQWFITLASQIKNAPRRLRRRAIDVLAPAGALLMKRGSYPRARSARLGYALFIAPTDGGDADAVCRAIVERAAMTNAFTPALLAPLTWLEPAQNYGIPMESTLTPSAVARCGGEWTRYSRRRIADAIEVFQPVSVVTVGQRAHEAVTLIGLDIAESLGSSRSEKEG